VRQTRHTCLINNTPTFLEKDVPFYEEAFSAVEEEVAANVAALQAK